MAETETRKFTEEQGVEDSALKPCPFCGYEHPKRHEVREHVLKGDKSFERKWYRVCCPACGVMTARAAIREMANGDWNNRVG